MIKPIEQPTPFQPEFGDVNIYGLASYILPATELSEDDHYVGLDYFSLSPWDGLWKAGIDMVAQAKACAEHCPITGLNWFGWIPIGIITADFARYSHGVPAHMRQMASDIEWNRNYFPTDAGDVNDIVRTMLGTGYSLGIMPYDGSGEIKLFDIQLDNGDKVIGAGHVWYNK